MATTVLLMALAGVLVFVLVWLVGGLVGILHGAPFVPSSRKRVREMIAMASIQPGEKVYELGSGDGRLVFAALEHTEYATGVEVSWPQYVWSRVMQVLLRKGGSLVRANLFDVSVRDADVVVCYLFPPIMKRLRAKLERELKSGTKVVTHAFPVPGWPIERAQDGIFLQKKP